MNNQPVLSIDVSKSESYAAFFLSYGQPYQKPFKFQHSSMGMNSLIHNLLEIEQTTRMKPEVVLEATGNYSKPIVSFFQHAGYKVTVINPILTHQLKKKSVRKVKTDITLTELLTCII